MAIFHIQYLLITHYLDCGAGGGELRDYKNESRVPFHRSYH